MGRIGKVKHQLKRTGEKAQDIAKDKGEKAGIALENARKMSKEYMDRVQKNRLNPLYLEDLESMKCKPFLLRIVSGDKKHQDNPLCAGAIGWMDNKKGVEIMTLYEANVSETFLELYPFCRANMLYCVNPYVTNQYIEITNYFDEILSGKLAELEHIAFMLGAKHYSVELQEESLKIQSKDKEISARMKGKEKTNNIIEKNVELIDESQDILIKQANKSSKFIRIVAESTFENATEPRLPNLKWFKNNKPLVNLIEMRCAGGDIQKMTSKQLILEAKAQDEMSIEFAGKVDAVIQGLGFKGNFSVKGKIEEEARRVLIYKLDF